jgi:hypothetical protein
MSKRRPATYSLLITHLSIKMGTINARRLSDYPFTLPAVNPATIKRWPYM